MRFSLLLILLAILAPLRGQDGPIRMRPEFPLIFPLTQDGNVVTVKYPILLNPLTVLKPGTQLRIIYNLSNDDQDAPTHPFAHKGSLEDSFARDPSASSAQPASDLPIDVQHEIDGYRHTVWAVSGNFVMAMAQYPTESMHLVFSPTGKGSDVHDERFTFFDGLMIGQPDGKVTVIAVEKESKSEKAGIKAGDEIVSVGGIPIQNNLNAFASAYSNAKKIATENELSNYQMTIRSPTSADARIINISMPPRIKAG